MPDGSQLTPRDPMAASTALLTLPNIITVARLCAVPLAVWLILQRRVAEAFFLFVAAGASDAVDGWLARHAGTRSALGALLDPVADKALLVTMYVSLAATGALPDWLAILVVFRDLLIVGGVLVLSVLGTPAQIRPLFISKVNTAVQIVLVATVLFLNGFHLAAPGLVTALVWLVAATTLLSGAGYLRRTLASPLHGPTS
jgi:cardiolipin synthase